jgi:hypothetical protein
LVNKCKRINPYHEKELNNLEIFTKKGVTRFLATLFEELPESNYPQWILFREYEL